MKTKTLIACAILACSSLLGCRGLTIGPVVERKAIVVRAGTAIEVLEDVEVEARLLQGSDPFLQEIGGWVVMHPDHWESLKREITRLRQAGGK